RSDSIIELLDPARLKSCIERVLRQHGASSEEFVLHEVKKDMTTILQEELLLKLTTCSDTAAKQTTLELNNRLRAALKEMLPGDLVGVLSSCAENYRGLWILRSYGNTQLDPYRRLALSLFKQDPERGVTKRDFQEA